MLINVRFIILTEKTILLPKTFKVFILTSFFEYLLLSKAFTGLYSAADLEQSCLSAGIPPIQVSAIVEAWNGKYAAAVGQISYVCMYI